MSFEENYGKATRRLAPLFLLFLLLLFVAVLLRSQARAHPAAADGAANLNGRDHFRLP